MGKIGAYQPIEKYKNYSMPTSKPLKSHAFYKEKIWTLQEKIHKQLKKVAEFLEGLYPKMTENFSMNIKVAIAKNLEILTEDLKLLQGCLQKNPDSFNTNMLNTNQNRITEMKTVCDALQTVSSYEDKFLKLSKIKHALHELEHLIQPTSLEISSARAPVKNKTKITSAKKAKIKLEPKKKIKKGSTVSPKKPTVTAKKASTKKATAKGVTPKKTNVKKVTPKKASTKKANLITKSPAKKLLTAQKKPKIKSPAAPKKKLSF